jgi:hypothetical protein
MGKEQKEGKRKDKGIMKGSETDMYKRQTGRNRENNDNRMDT